MVPANWKKNRTMQAAGYRPKPANGPTTTTTPEPAQCKPEDQAKLIKKFAEWCAERDRLTKEISEYDAKYPPGHWFNKNNPYELSEYERGQELQRERGKLVHDYGELLKDATTCGAKQDEKTGDILWPDGTRTTIRPPK